MKKILFTMMAVCAMTLCLTSCDNMADPVKEPVAGKQFYSQDAVGYTEFQFHMNHVMTLVSRTEIAGNVTTDCWTWSMNNSKVTIKGDSKSAYPGKVVYTGIYHADTHTLTVTEHISGTEATGEFQQAGY